MSTMPRHMVCCTVQNRLGALDRVIGALSLRGIIPHQLVVTQDTENDQIQVFISFTGVDAKGLEKLVKAFYKQVYVVSVNLVVDPAQGVDTGSPTEEATNSTTMADAAINNVSPFVPLYVKRKVSHANHA
jgi:hypothetical protein